MAVNIPRIAGLEPKVAKLLETIKLAIEEIQSGSDRALRFSDLGDSFSRNRDGSIDFNPIVVPSVAPEIRLRIEQLEAARFDVSTIAEELLGSSRFGTLLAQTASDAKTLKVNINGHVAGYGVAAYGGASGPTTSDFIIQADRFSVVIPNPPWLASQAYTLGQYVSATTNVGNFIFEVTTAGTTGTVEPTWDVTLGHTNTSGTVTFTTRAISERVPFIAGLINGVQGVGINGDLLVDGTIRATAIEAESITADQIAAGSITAEELAANLVLSQAIELSTTGYIRSGQSAYDTGIGFYLTAGSGTPKFSIGNSGAHKVTWNGTTLTVIGNVAGALDASSIVGQIPPSNFDISALGWTISSVFSATDADTVEWTSGELLTAAGDSYAISSGSTGDMTVRTYIYFDLNASTTALQTTTSSAAAVGAGKVLVAVAEDDSPDAFFQVFGGSGSFGVSSPTIPTFGALRNGDFETNDATGWVGDASWTVDASAPITGTYSARIATSSTGMRSDPFPAAPGDRFLISCDAKRDGGDLPDAALRLEVRWSSGAFSSELSTASSSTSGVQFLRIIVTVPPGETSGAVVIRKSTGASGHWFADDVFVTPMIRSADVVLGSATGVIDLATQISGVLTTSFAAAGLINANVTINADGTLSGAGSGQAALASLPGVLSAAQLDALIQAALGDSPDNLLENGGGEEGTVGSLATGWTNGNGNSLLVASDQQRVGARSLKIVNGSAVDSYNYQAFSVVAGAVYEVSGWVKVSALTGTGAGAYLNIDILSGITSFTILEKVTVGTDPTPTEPDCGIARTSAGSPVDWTFVRCRFIPNGSNGNLRIYGQLGLGAGVAGTAWFDGIVVRRLYNVTSGDLLDGAIITAKLAAGAVTAAKINAGTITANEISAATITGDRIAANTITGANVVALSITTAELAANSVTAAKIAAATITANEISANTITAGQVALNTLTAANIAASSITGSRIAAATILGTNIAAGTITAANLSAGTITANELAVNSVVANTIATGAVTAGKLAVTLAYAGEIIIDPAGMIRSGQTNFNTGTGWFLGNSGGVPVFSIGNQAANNLTWNGSVLAISGSVNLTNAAQVFAPAWTGFSTPPVGNFSYIDFGSYVILYWAGAGALAGTSSSQPMSITNLPAAITPSSNRVVQGGTVIGAPSGVSVGISNVTPAGQVIFGFVSAPSAGGGCGFNGSFNPSGAKGLSVGWLIIYPK